MRFSVIIPAYNVEKYIKAAIESVINQTYKNYELIIIDDYSTDNTKKIIEQYKNKITFIQNKKNEGVSKTRNIGLEKARGEYIIFLDSDDILKSSDVLEKIDSLISNDKPDIIYLGCEFKNSKEIILSSYEQRKNLKYSILDDRLQNIWSKCWNKEFLNKNKIRFIENLKYYEDVPFCIHGICLAKKFKVADFITHLYTDNRKESATDDFNCCKNIRTVTDIFTYITELIKITELVPKETREYVFALIKRATLESTTWIDLLEKHLEN